MSNGYAVLGFVALVTLTGCQRDPRFQSTQTDETRILPSADIRTAPSRESRSNPDFEVVDARSAVAEGRVGQIIIDLARGNGASNAAALMTLINEMMFIAKSPSGQTRPMTETCEVVLGELRMLREFVAGESLVVQRSTGNVLELSPAHVDTIARGAAENGVVLSGPHLELAIMFARPASVTDWTSARQSRITSGRWTGAYRTDVGDILLPGIAVLRAGLAAP